MPTRIRIFTAFMLALTLTAVYMAFRYQPAHAQQNCTAPPTGMAAWYPFDGNALDVQGGSHAALSGGPTFAAGKAGQALHLDGADDSAKVPASANLNVGAGGGMSVALWVNPADTSDHALVEWNRGPTNCGDCFYGAHLWMANQSGSPGGLYANLIDTQGNGHVIQSSPGILTADAYQHVALSYDKANGLARLYLNGAVVAEQNLGSFTPQTSYDLYFGFRPAGAGSPGRFKGAMDEVQIFNRALAQSDVQALYDAGNAGTRLCRQADSVQFLTAALPINEVNGSASLVVTRTGNASGTASVHYATTGGTATPGVDYTPVSGTLSFAEGESSKTISIPISVDSVAEPDETFEVTLSSPVGGTSLGAPATEVVTIADPTSPTQPGRIIAQVDGGLVEFNQDFSFGVNLTSSPTQDGCNDDPGYLDRHPSVSRDGKLVAFQSKGGGRGVNQYRVFAMNSDGTNVRQLTFDVPPGDFQADQVNDTYPVISPDGTRVAFVSNRQVYTFSDGVQARVSNLYVVNTDGTGLRQVTGFQPNLDQNGNHAGGGDGSTVVVAAWSPDGSRLAFRGVRHPIGNDGKPINTFYFVVATIGADGSGEATVATHITSGQGMALEWGPDGQLAYIWGGEAQGAAAERLVVNGSEYLFSDYPEIADAPDTPGGIRFSPDGQRLGWINYEGRFVTVNVNATGRSATPLLGLETGGSFWWQPGAPMLAPGRLELSPDPVTVWESGSVQLRPTLFDVQGNVIDRAATAWRLGRCSFGSARVSSTGLVTAGADVNYTDKVCASNGGVSDCSDLLNYDIPVLSVSATTPEARRSGAGGPGVFTITRAGNPTGALAISFALTGAAVRDVDFTLDASGGTISDDKLTMASNQTSATVNVRPISDSESKGDKTLSITLQPDAANAYALDDQAKSAQVTLRDDRSLPTPTPAPTLSAVTPDKGGDVGSVTATIYGQNIKPGATAALQRTGQPDISATGVSVAPNGSSLNATFSLTGRARGAWDIVVTNPDKQTGTLAGAFTVEENKAGEVWVDVVGRYTMRSDVEQTFYLVYGNSGNVDAPATLIQVFLPAGLSVARLPQLADGEEPSVIQEDEGGTILELLTPKVTAGWSGALPMRLKAAGDLAHKDVQIRAFALSSVSLQQEADSTVNPNVAVKPQIVFNTPEHGRMSINVSDGAESEDYTVEVTKLGTTDKPEDPQVELAETDTSITYTITATVPASSSGGPVTSSNRVGSGDAARPDVPEPSLWEKTKTTINRAKKAREVYEEYKKLQAAKKKASLEGKVTACLNRSGILTKGEADNAVKLANGAVALQKAKLAKAILELLEKGAPITEALGEIDKLEPIMDQAWYKRVTNIVNGKILNSINDKTLSFPEDLVVQVTQNQKFPVGPNDYARRLIFRYIVLHCKCALANLIPSPAPSEERAAAPTATQSLRASRGHLSPGEDTCGCSKCQRMEKTIDLTVVFSQDPNDKIGPQGFGVQHYLTDMEPLQYAVFFENKADATAPAQKVVVTDQLDTSKLDLSTFALGAFSFGDTVVAAPPGLSNYTTDVDLRPAKNLIVRLNAHLDKGTGLLTVQFTSLDPATMQPTTDPLAGFLPPDKNPPEGQGSIIFSVRPKTDLASGTEIRNKASIVFDSNAPIDTPEWVNTIDASKPSSKVQPLAAHQGSTNFAVNWSGVDTGSGVATYTVLVSKNGGDYTEWLSDTTATSAVFHGDYNATYNFFTVARDGAGNAEDAHATADAATTTPASSSVSEVAGSGAYNGTATLKATLSSAGSPVGGKSVAFTLNGSPLGSVVTGPDGVATLTGVSLSGVAVGTYAGAVGASFAGDTGFAAVSGTGALTVVKASQAITFAAPADVTFGDADFSLSASASSSLSVGFSATGQCTVTGSTVHLKGAGSCTVTASQGGDSNFNAAADVARSFQIARATTATTVSSTLNPSAQGQAITFKATVTSPAGTPAGAVQFKADGVNLGSPQGLNASGAASVSASGLQAGAHTITAEYGGDSNFNSSAGTLAGSQVVGSAFEFTQSNYTVSERGGSVAITVKRTGDTSGAVSVDYSTDDASTPSVAVPCSSVTGIALERCDYTCAAGTLNWAAGDASDKSFTVLVNDDSYTEGSETISMKLANPSGGAALGPQSTATLQITDDSPESSGNPVDDASFFVTQHYHDFLNREPDASGLQFWSGGITTCGADTNCRDVKRVDTSAAFFLSIEFQETGYLVERIYKTAYGDATGSSTFPSPHTLAVPVVRLDEFLIDTQRIGQNVVVGQGAWQQQLEENKQVFALEFVSRPRFASAFPATQTPAQFVDALFANAGVSPTTAERNAAVAEFGSAASTDDNAARARALRDVAQNSVFARAEFNRAFVLMQFFGYLRRNPNDAPDADYTGYDFWLTKLNQFGGDFVQAEMVKAFISSTEYRQRFGQ